MNPTPHRLAAHTPAQRGPTSSNHLPATAVLRPRKTMAVANTPTMAVMLQSSALLAATPSSLVSAGLKMLQE